MSTLPPPTPPNPASRPPIDPLLQQRIANARRPVAAPSPAAATGRTLRRAKPAHGAKVLSLAASVATTLGLTAAFAQASHDDTSTLELATTATTATTATPSTAPSTEVVAVSTGETSVTSATTSTSVGVAAGQIADGTYVGEASTNKWGTVQVQAVYQGGQLVDVEILSYPDADRKSVQINQRVLPQLIEEAVAIQSADVDSISGATYTVNSYRESLQSAIDAALAASSQA